jgi:3-oxoacyl-[acyl-carrier-protein] synthase-3
VAIGRHARTTGARIAGVVSCLPPRVVENDSFIEQFGDGVAEVTKMTGVERRYYVEEGVTTSDMCFAAANRLMDKLGWERDSVDGFIFVTQSPDFPLPATACLLQDRLGLSTNTIAFDVNLGCSGYPYGLWMTMAGIQTGAMKRVLLAVGDISSRTIDTTDRSTALLFGDCGTVTAIEASDDEDSDATFVLGTDGRGGENLVLPTSRHRNVKAEGKLEGRDLSMVYMDGAEIFNFTLKSVPPLIRESVELAGKSIDDYDAFLLHQANKFMITHIAKKAKLPKEKVPINIDRYGNTSSATIPLLMTTDMAESLSTDTRQIGMFGFGVGYSWASASMKVGPLQCVETITL